MEVYSSDDIKRKKKKYEERTYPLEDRLNRIINKYENMLKLLLQTSDIIDNNLNSLQEHLDSLETRFNALEQTMTKNQKIPIVTQPALAPTIKKKLLEHPRKTLINERLDLFDKRNQHRYSRREFQGMYDATFKIIIFGDADCGKVELTQRFLTNLFVSDQTMTIGVDFEVKSLTVNGYKVKLQIWDFGGEERFRFLLPTYVRGARGGIFLYDITNYSSLAHIDDWLSVIRKEIRAEDIFPILVVGNKAHLVNDREVPGAEGIRIAKSRGVNGFIEVSAKTGENVEKAFKALTGLMLDDSKPRRVGVKPAIIDEIGLEQVKESIQGYINQKSKTNKQITRARTIKAIKKSLKLAEKDQSGDDDIWAFTISLSKSICTRITPKTIYFNPGFQRLIGDDDVKRKKRKSSNILNKLLGSIPNVTSAVILSTEGFPIEFLLPEGIDETKIAAMTAALFSLSEKAIIEMGKGDFEEFYIIGSEGHLLVMQAGPNMILIASTTKSVKDDNRNNDDRNDDDGYTFPYIFEPPDPPGGSGLIAPQIQIKKTLHKELENEYVCQYCGIKLTREEEFSHNCRKHPE